MITESIVRAETITTWLSDAGDEINAQADYLTQLDAAIEGVVELGAAAAGDKTMVDALLPAARAMHESLDSGRSLDEAAQDAAEAARAGAEATVPMQARKGRASYLGERSIGHQDPGATSAAIILAALSRAVSSSTS